MRIAIQKNSSLDQHKKTQLLNQLISSVAETKGEMSNLQLFHTVQALLEFSSRTNVRNEYLKQWIPELDFSRLGQNERIAAIR